MDHIESESEISIPKRRSGTALLLLAILLAVAIIISFLLGRYNVPIGDLFRLFLSKVIPIEPTWTPQLETVIFNVRLPRILTACLIGGALAAAGAAYQGVFQNPMASPDILGATAGAAFGAALAILLNLPSVMITVLAFAFSLATVVFVFFIGSHATGERVVSLVLAGLMVSSIFTAATSFVKLIADTSNQLPAITYWLMGSLSGVSMGKLGFVAISIAIGLLPLFLLRWRMNILAMGDVEMRTMGLSATRMRVIVVGAATLLSAASVSVSGMIGWVGLVIPHFCRKIFGSNYQLLLPASVLAGAIFMLLVDNISRNLLAVEIPIGILTAFIGAPFFIYLITGRERS